MRALGVGGGVVGGWEDEVERWESEDKGREVKVWTLKLEGNYNTLCKSLEKCNKDLSGDHLVCLGRNLYTHIYEIEAAKRDLAHIFSSLQFKETFMPPPQLPPPQLPYYALEIRQSYSGLNF